MKDTRSLYEKLEELFEEVEPKVSADLGDGFEILSIYPIDKLVADKYGGSEGFHKYGRWIEDLPGLLSLVMRPIRDKWIEIDNNLKQSFQDIPRIAQYILADCIRGCPATVEKKDDRIIFHINVVDALNRLDDYIKFGERWNTDQFIEKSTLKEWHEIGVQGPQLSMPYYINGNCVGFATPATLPPWESFEK